MDPRRKAPSKEGREPVFDRGIGPGALSVKAAPLAARLGWARTYDAEQLALAERLEVSLRTLGAGLAKTADLVGLVPPDSI